MMYGQDYLSAHEDMSRDTDVFVNCASYGSVMSSTCIVSCMFSLGVPGYI